jgi:hypothetical protein
MGAHMNFTSQSGMKAMDLSIDPDLKKTAAIKQAA